MTDETTTQEVTASRGDRAGASPADDARLRIALPSKGRLADGALDLLERAGLEPAVTGARSLRAELGEDFTALFVRAKDIPEFVADGAADLGITGSDLVAEAGRPLDTLLGLGFGRCRLAIAVRDEADLAAAGDIPDGARVATSFPRTTEQWFTERGRRIELVPVSGAAEIAPHIGVADVIVDLVSTGSTLRMNGLREVDTVLEAEAVLVAREGYGAGGGAGRDGEAPGDAAVRVAELATALESVLRARGRRYLMANVPKDALDRVKEVLPGINGPTIVDVMDSGRHVAAHAVVAKADVYRTIAALKELGAQGILVTKIERLMP